MFVEFLLWKVSYLLIYITFDIFTFCVCVCTYEFMCTIYMQEPMEVRRGGYLGAGRGCEPADVGAGNGTPVFCKSSKLLTAESSPHPWAFFYFLLVRHSLYSSLWVGSPCSFITHMLHVCWVLNKAVLSGTETGEWISPLPRHWAGMKHCYVF